MMLEQAAADRWGVPVSEVEAKEPRGRARIRPAIRSASATSLRRPANSKSRPPDKLQLKDPSKFRYIGKEGINIVDAFDITTGRAKYGEDVHLPGMKYAVIARPPVMGGKVASYDASETRESPGLRPDRRDPGPPPFHRRSCPPAESPSSPITPGPRCRVATR